jgi:hypothetical protein
MVAGSALAEALAHEAASTLAAIAAAMAFIPWYVGSND